MINEEWKVIPSHPNYEASSFGRIRRFKNKRVLKTADADKIRPYQVVCLFTNGKQYTKKAARLVWEAFNGPCGETIDHIDRNPANNYISNLRCVSCEENYKNRTIYNKKTNLYNLTTEKKVEIITRYRTGELTTWGIMKNYGIPMNYIKNVIDRGSWDKLANGPNAVQQIQANCNQDNKELSAK